MQLKQITARRIPFSIGLVAAVAVFAFGIYPALFGHAATPVVTVESESGAISGPAATVADTSASGNKAVQFKSGTGTATPPPATGNSLYQAFCAGNIAWTTSGTMQSDAMNEISGIAPSHHLANAYWTNNDSGDSARLFAVKFDGTLLGIFNIANASAADWEDIDLGPGPAAGVTYLYIADTGNNAMNRTTVYVYRLPEPNPSIGGGTATASGAVKIGLKYPDGKPHNAEAMMVDQQTGELYIVDKVGGHAAGVFHAPANLANGSVTTMTQVGTLSYPKSGGGYELATGADISPDNSTIAIRTYDRLRIYSKAGTSVAAGLAANGCVAPVHSEGQAEAVGFKLSSQGVVTTSEGLHRPIYNYDPK